MWSLLNLVCQRRRAEAPGITDYTVRGLQPGALEGSLQEVAQWLGMGDLECFAWQNTAMQ